MNQSVLTPPPSRAVDRIGSSAIRELLALVDRPGVISLAGGLPSPELFPVDETRAVLDEVLRDPGALQYSSTEGDPALRAWIAENHGVGPDRVLITHGSQQALDLVARATLEDGDAVALADPGYVGAVQAMRLSGGRLVGLPTDADGLCVEALGELLDNGLRPRLVYVVPNFHNPTGASLSAARARLLAHLADHFGFLVVEDDPYGAIRFSGEAPPALASLTDRTVSIGTISKVLFPGLRVGWVVGPPDLTRSLALVKQAVDLHTATLAQRLAHGLLARPDFLGPHLTTLRAHYAGQATVLHDALVAAFGDVLELGRPEGGLFLWTRLRGHGVDTGTRLADAIAAGVGYVPGSAFSVSRPQRHALRLSYATVTPPELEEGARRLAGVLLAPPSTDGGGGRPDPDRSPVSARPTGPADRAGRLGRPTGTTPTSR